MPAQTAIPIVERRRCTFECVLWTASNTTSGRNVGIVVVGEIAEHHGASREPGIHVFASSVFLPQTFEFSGLYRNGWIEQENQVAFHFGMQRFHRILRNRRVDIDRDTVFGDDLCNFTSVGGNEDVHNPSIHLFCDIQGDPPVDVQVDPTCSANWLNTRNCRLRREQSRPISLEWKCHQLYGLVQLAGANEFSQEFGDFGFAIGNFLVGAFEPESHLGARKAAVAVDDVEAKVVECTEADPVEDQIGKKVADAKTKLSVGERLVLVCDDGKKRRSVDGRVHFHFGNFQQLPVGSEK
jgi:hypothetical protein